ncbi:MAG: polysaccharide biosynthesis tyrosine autokinase [Lachnospira eligens]
MLYASDVPNFCMIFAGPVPPNLSELVGNDRFVKMVEEARATFDMIIIDTPPISVIDAAVISKVCDGGILVIGAGDISYKFARKSKEQLEMTGCKLGCVLTKVDMTGNSYYGKYYGKYYGSYYGKYYGHEDNN